jgi:hypothetical protein
MTHIRVALWVPAVELTFDKPFMEITAEDIRKALPPGNSDVRVMGWCKIKNGGGEGGREDGLPKED